MVAAAVTGRGLHADLAVRRRDGFALRVTLSIDPDTTVALLGPNGAGKSTAASAIAGLVPLDEGEIALDGRRLDAPADGVFVAPEDRNIGVVFQNGLLFPHLTVLENAAFGLRSRGVDRHEARRRGAGWLERLAVGHLAERLPADLSGGQAQRVVLARALAPEPDLLLLDEPLSALDVTVRAEIRHVLSEHLAGFGGPRLLITHDPTEAFLLADRVCVIEDGSITQTGTADEIRLSPRTPYAADLAGVNVVFGTASNGIVATDHQDLSVADAAASGPVVVTIHPTAISLYPEPPHGSPRNTWKTRIERVERLGPRIRLRTGAPIPLTVEVTEQSRTELGLEPGAEVWVAVKATEIRVADA
jgi:molybdate transport system ATP-binding protein